MTHPTPGRANLEEAMSRHWHAWELEANEALRLAHEAEDATRVPLADDRARVATYRDALQRELDALFTDDDARLFAHSQAVETIAADFQAACELLRQRADSLHAEAMDDPRQRQGLPDEDVSRRQGR